MTESEHIFPNETGGAEGESEEQKQGQSSDNLLSNETLNQNLQSNSEQNEEKSIENPTESSEHNEKDEAKNLNTENQVKEQKNENQESLQTTEKNQNTPETEEIKEHENKEEFNANIENLSDQIHQTHDNSQMKSPESEENSEQTINQQEPNHTDIPTNSDEGGEDLPPESEQHPLQSDWTFYYFVRPEPDEEWEESIHPIGTFSTVEKFWAFYSHICSPDQLNEDFAIHLFKEDYKAMWESENIKNGGYFTIRIKDTKQIQYYWEKLILNMIGEQLGNNVLGAVVSKRVRQRTEDEIWYSIELWLDFVIDDDDEKDRRKYDIMRMLIDKLAILGKLQYEYTDFKQFRSDVKEKRKIEYYLYDGNVVKPIDAPIYNKSKRPRRQ